MKNNKLTKIVYVVNLIWLSFLVVESIFVGNITLGVAWAIALAWFIMFWVFTSRQDKFLDEAMEGWNSSNESLGELLEHINEINKSKKLNIQP